MLTQIAGEGINNPNRKVSAAIIAGSLIFTGGQAGRNHQTGLLPAGIKDQTKQALDNIEIILNKAGSNLNRLVFINVYLADMSDYKQYNEAWNEFFDKVSRPYPARVTVEVSKLPSVGMLVEMQAVAQTGDA